MIGRKDHIVSQRNSLTTLANILERNAKNRQLLYFPRYSTIIAYVIDYVAKQFLCILTS